MFTIFNNLQKSLHHKYYKICGWYITIEYIIRLPHCDLNLDLVFTPTAMQYRLRDELELLFLPGKFLKRHPPRVAYSVLTPSTKRSMTTVRPWISYIYHLIEAGPYGQKIWLYSANKAAVNVVLKKNNNIFPFSLLLWLSSP